jgi:site-specific DNA recombinase
LGTCSNDHRIRREELERRVLDGLKHRLLAPELVEQFARDFQEEVNRLAAALNQSRAQDQGQLEAVRRKIASMIRAIEDGLYQPSMKGRMAELEAEKAVLEARLATAPALPKVRLHPNLAGMYRQKVAALEQALADPEIKAEAAEIVRSQIERITLTPNAEDGLDVHLYGDLARILQLCEAGERKSERPGTGVPGRELSVVAGAHNHLCRTIMVWSQSYRWPLLGAEQTCHR